MEIGSETWKDVIYQGAKYFGALLSHDHLYQFEGYAKALIKWNSKINLTAITDPFEIAVKHIVDSIAPFRLICPAANLLDVGSGAGLPGIPIKIALPNIDVTLIDTSRKKISFQKFIIHKLGLVNIAVVHARIETLSQNFMRSRTTRTPVNVLSPPSQAQLARGPITNQFEVIICRALFSLEEYVMSVLPLVTPTGIIVALKADLNESNLNSLKVCLDQSSYQQKGAHSQFDVTIHRYVLPFIEAKRTLIIVHRKDVGKHRFEFQNQP